MINQGAESNDQTAKADSGKARLSLVPFSMLEPIAIIREYGNAKYGDSENWKTVEPDRYKDAMLRHLFAWLENSDSKDEESELPHFWHFLCNCAFIAEMEKNRTLRHDIEQHLAKKKELWDKMEAEK